MEPRSAEQARAPGRTTAMVPCSWLEMRWGLCTGRAGEPGRGPLLPSALALRETLGRSPARSEPCLHPCHMWLGGPSQHKGQTCDVGRGCLEERSGLGVPLPHHVWGPRLR